MTIINISDDCPKCGDGVWLRVLETDNLRCDYCGYEYDGIGEGDARDFVLTG